MDVNDVRPGLEDKLVTHLEQRAMQTKRIEEGPQRKQRYADIGLVKRDIMAMPYGCALLAISNDRAQAVGRVPAVLADQVVSSPLNALMKTQPSQEPLD